MLGIFTGKDIHTAGIGSIPFPPIPGFPMGKPIETLRPTPAFERVRYVGKQIALVVVDTPVQVIDAADQVEIEGLPAVVDIERAMKPQAPVLWPRAPDNAVLT